jgi:hypothetical protein
VVDVEDEFGSVSTELTMSEGVIESREDPALPTKIFFVTRPLESWVQCLAVTTTDGAMRIPEQKPVVVAE